MRIADFDEIRAGSTTDIYFRRTEEVLRKLGVHKCVTAAVAAASFPGGAGWAVATGVDDALAVMEGLPLDVEAVEEGTLIRPGDPVMQITGDYLEFCVLETAILGYLCQQSGIATRAARCRKAAGDRALVSFGARRMHPALAPIIERNAYIGGCDGVSVVLAAELLGIQPSGTMPHALIIVLGDITEAVRRYDEIIDPAVPRVALVDTFCDEKAESLRAAETIGERLSAVRLDTPGSRRGDMRKILEEVRWELDLRGFRHVKLFVSGGVDEAEILHLNPYADGYGVGTAISSASTIDFALDIVEVEDEPVAKRGKKSGRKQVLRCDRCFDTVLVPYRYPPSALVCPCGGRRGEMLTPALQSGRLASRESVVARTRTYVANQLTNVEL